MGLHPSHHSIQDGCADVVKVDIDIALGGLLELLPPVLVLIVDALVGTNALDPAALRVVTGETDD